MEEGFITSKSMHALAPLVNELYWAKDIGFLKVKDKVGLIIGKEKKKASICKECKTVIFSYK